MKLFYGRTTVRMPRGYQFRNLRKYLRPENDVEEVMVEYDHPQLIHDYGRMGVPVRTSDGEVNGITLKNVSSTKPLPPTTDVEIPEDWRDLGWNELRALAKAASGMIVINKEEAVLAIETALEARGGV